MPRYYTLHYSKTFRNVIKKDGENFACVDANAQGHIIIDELNMLHNELERFKFTLTDAINQERTAMGKSVLMQLADNLEIEYDI